MDKLIAIPVMLFFFVILSAVAYGAAPIISTVGGVACAIYAIEQAKGKFALPVLFLFPVLVITFGTILMVGLCLPAALIWGEPIFGYYFPNINDTFR